MYFESQFQGVQSMVVPLFLDVVRQKRHDMEGILEESWSPHGSQEAEWQEESQGEEAVDKVYL